MGRPRRGQACYQADLNDLIKLDIPNITRISRINDNGDFHFTYSHPTLTTASVLEVDVASLDHSSYPSEHLLLPQATNEVPQAVTVVLENFGLVSSGQKLHEAMFALSAKITSSIERVLKETDCDEDDPDTPVAGIGIGLGSDEDDGEFEDFGFDDDNYYTDDIFGLNNEEATETRTLPNRTIPLETIERTWRDFRAVRHAGFKISKICGFNELITYNIVSISVRADKLCLSEETRGAWNIQASDYIILLIRYTGQYTTFDEALDKAAESSNIDFRLRKCAQYKPSIDQAIKAFSPREVSQACITSADLPLAEAGGGNTDLALLGVGESIDNLMKNDFIPMLKLRCNYKMAWDAAKQELVALKKKPLYDRQQTSVITNSGQLSITDEEAIDKIKLPGFIARDYTFSKDEVSLPLVAAQFAMRFCIRCTDYCMVCHQKIAGNFEALKPYVCSDSLCLFQYMNMGFGPNIDLEVLNQPHVVDLLISFCYSGLQRVGHGGTITGLREYPTGLDLKVPKVFPQAYSNSTVLEEIPIEGAKLVDPLSGMFNRVELSFTLNHYPASSNIREGCLVAVVVQQATESNAAAKRNIIHHCRVSHIAGSTLSLTIAKSHTFPISPITDNSLLNLSEPLSAAHLLPYNHSLDDLDDATKAFAMTILLAATPPVSSMRHYLKTAQNRSLDNWPDLVPSAAKLLRWIIASNRSYIVQVDELASGNGSLSDGPLARHHERISGVDGWIQFRFAQGSPEKEIQFQKELKTVLKPQKTILAWHGSSLGNWHSIIRMGLDFKSIVNGRAYGHGVYFGRDFDTSLNYTGQRKVVNPINSFNSSTWPNSILNITNAISLSELVNKPDKFVNPGNSRCYVVDKLHWIQCRYLFVKTGNASLVISQPTSTDLQDEFKQDSQYTASGPGGQKIWVPKAAIPSANESASEKFCTVSKQDENGHMGDIESDEPEDFDELGKTNDTTDFRPGTLDFSTLPRLADPSYATSQGQRAISREIKKLQKLQSETFLQELGWYINFDNITNMYHWIVELHSLDPELPLTQDMKKAGVSSIVLEIRFGREFPYSPPFLRIIRPRFLPFGNGGGGHVTVGGAMCMELLTNSGWSAVNSLESVLLQVRMALTSTEPRAARLQSTNGPGRDYGIMEAYEAYERAAKTHGWSIPNDLQEAATAMMVKGPEN